MMSEREFYGSKLHFDTEMSYSEYKKKMDSKVKIPNIFEEMKKNKW